MDDNQKDPDPDHVQLKTDDGPALREEIEQLREENRSLQESNTALGEENIELMGEASATVTSFDDREAEALLESKKANHIPWYWRMHEPSAKIVSQQLLGAAIVGAWIYSLIKGKADMDVALRPFVGMVFVYWYGSGSAK